MELALAAVNGITLWLAWQMGNWMVGVYTALFCARLLFASGMTIGQSITVERRQRVKTTRIKVNEYLEL